MKKYKCLLVVLLFANGCASQAPLIRELAKDPATVQITVTSLYGTISLVRVNPKTNSMAHSINADGSVRVGDPSK